MSSALKAVEDLNYSLPSTLIDEGVCFEYMDNGYSSAIKFADAFLWDSENHYDEFLKGKILYDSYLDSDDEDYEDQVEKLFPYDPDKSIILLMAKYHINFVKEQLSSVIVSATSV